MLKWQEETLTGDTSSVDVASAGNLQALVDVGNGLLKKAVSRMNLETGRSEVAQGEGTNEEALTRFAKLISDERKLRRAINWWSHHIPVIQNVLVSSFLLLLLPRVLFNNNAQFGLNTSFFSYIHIWRFQ